MSAYSEVKTEFKDGEILIDALKEMGFSSVQNHIGQPHPLTGYLGDYRTADGKGHTTDPEKAMKADIIIPRAAVGRNSNDIGFVRDGDGSYSAIVSDYDSTKYGQAWQNKLRVKVAEMTIQQKMSAMGLRSLSKKIVDGKMVFEFLKA